MFEEEEDWGDAEQGEEGGQEQADDEFEWGDDVAWAPGQSGDADPSPEDADEDEGDDDEAGADEVDWDDGVPDQAGKAKAQRESGGAGEKEAGPGDMSLDLPSDPRLGLGGGGGEGAAATSCKKGHPLVQFNTPRGGFGCDHCGSRVPVGAAMRGCRKCNFDLCEACAAAAAPPAGSSSSWLGLGLTGGAGSAAAQKQARRRVTKDDRIAQAHLHRTHVLCWAAHGMQVSNACDTPLVQVCTVLFALYCLP